MKVLLVATTSPGKLREMTPLLAGLDLRLVTLAEHSPVAPPEETGKTFAENARLKALYYAAATGLLTVAEDSGLEIDALGGAPGVGSARFGGEQLDYPGKFALIYEHLRASNAMGSRARFVCAIALVQPAAGTFLSPPAPPTSPASSAEPPALLFEAIGTVEGLIAPEPMGTGGFGYDPIFFYPPFGTTLADAGGRKSNVSHRGAAFRALRSFLQDP